jgi:hypothetical protein
MAQTLYPTAIVAKAGLGGLVTDIDDDPASPDGNWCTSGSVSTYSGSGAGTLTLAGQGVGVNTGGAALTVTGTGFGTKAIAAPHRFFPLQTDANDTNCKSIAGLKSDGTAVAMEQYNADGGYPQILVATGENAWGKDLVGSRTVESTGGWTPAMGSFMPSGTNVVFGSMWLKITRSIGSGTGQWKTPRAGTGTSTDGNVNYSAAGIKFHTEMYWDSTGVIDDVYPSWNNSDNASFSGSNEVDGPASFKDGLNNIIDDWHCWQWWYSSGTAGNADGQMYMWCDGALVCKKSNLAVTLTGDSSDIQNQQYITGIQLLTAGTYTVRVSRPYCDTTRARIELINASTYANATGFLILRPTSWSDTEVVVEDLYLLSEPTGYDWVAVTNSSGTTQVFSR